MSKIITTGLLSGSVGGVPINTSLPCNPDNYNIFLSRNVAYIVMHYTGNAVDSAKGNANYFKNNAGIGASAHLFVDETSIYQSVRLCDRAWHCGDNTYYHPSCRNANSIGIEMCTSGDYRVSDKTKENAAQLCAYLCGMLGITSSDVDEYVLRHWDVTHKVCPAQMAGSSNAEWTTFKARVKAVLDQANKPKEEIDMTVAEVKKLIQDEAKKIAREEFAALEAERAKKAASKWAGPAIAAAKEMGVMSGDANGDFRPQSYVKREELAAVVINLRDNGEDKQ